MVGVGRHQDGLAPLRRPGLVHHGGRQLGGLVVARDAEEGGGEEEEEFNMECELESSRLLQLSCRKMTWVSNESTKIPCMANSYKKLSC